MGTHVHVAEHMGVASGGEAYSRKRGEEKRTMLEKTDKLLNNGAKETTMSDRQWKVGKENSGDWVEKAELPRFGVRLSGTSKKVSHEEERKRLDRAW